MKLLPRFNRIHVVCEYLHFGEDADFQCKGCPAWELSDYGRVQRGCYGLAKEACNIARYGAPRKKMPRAKVREWRKRSAVRKPPALRVVK